MVRYADLTEREKTILTYVIHQFILTANPVGSRNIFKKFNLGYSPATIRNVMADLEDSGFLGHPHTSAGRVPTDRGYRFYVDSLMDLPKIGKDEKELIDSQFENMNAEIDEVLKVTSSILSDLTNQLACVTFPKFGNAILEKIQLVPVSTNRLLVVLTIKSGMVRTITLEINAGYKQKLMQAVQKLLNERLSGLTFAEIRNSIKDRVKEFGNSDLKPVIRVFLDSVDQIFRDFRTSDETFITGAKNIIKQPEFVDHEQFKGIIELIEDKDVIIHIMDEKNSSGDGNVSITIGSESKIEKLNDYSMVVKEYKIGQISGSLGVIGPKRMEYSKTVSAVIYMAELLSNALKMK